MTTTGNALSPATGEAVADAAGVTVGLAEGAGGAGVGGAAAVAKVSAKQSAARPKRPRSETLLGISQGLFAPSSRMSGLPRDTVLGTEEKDRADAIEPEKQDERRGQRSVDVRKVDMRKVGGERILDDRPCDCDDAGAPEGKSPRDRLVRQPPVEHHGDDEDQRDREQIRENMSNAPRIVNSRDVKRYREHDRQRDRDH